MATCSRFMSPLPDDSGRLRALVRQCGLDGVALSNMRSRSGRFTAGETTAERGLLNFGAKFVLEPLHIVAAGNRGNDKGENDEHQGRS